MPSVVKIGFDLLRVSVPPWWIWFWLWLRHAVSPWGILVFPNLSAFAFIRGPNDSPCSSVSSLVNVGFNFLRASEVLI